MESIVYISMLVICLNILISLICKLFGVKTSCLSCGLVAYCGDVPADPNTLKLLMMFNQERGEDGTGIAVNNQITKDAEKVSKFLTTNKITITPEDKNYTFIGHARKSSSGGYAKNKELAHPFGMYQGDAEKDNYDLILAMNGTMINTEAMSKEFDVPFKYGVNSDTQLLSRIMVKLGNKDFIKALQAYDGTATLVFFSPKFTNTLMVYKDPDRPLFYWNKAKNQMYVSSMEEPLLSIGAPSDEIKTFTDNHLYRINKGKITKTEKVERSPVKTKVIPTRSRYGNTRYGDEDVYNFGQGGGGCMRPFLDNHTRSSDNNIIDITTKSIVPNRGRTGNHIYTQIDKYYRNGHPLTGELILNNNGKIGTIENEEFKKYYFVAGFLIKGKTEYDVIRSNCNSTSGEFNLAKFKNIKLSEFCGNFQMPCNTVCENKEQFLLSGEWLTRVSKPGDKLTYRLLFTNLVFELEYTGRVIKGGFIKICDFVSVKQLESSKPDVRHDEEDLPTGKNATETIKAIIAKQIGEESHCGNIFKEVMDRLKISGDTSKRRRFFIRRTLCIFNEYGVISKQNMDDLLTLGEPNFPFESGEFGKEFDKVISLYKYQLTTRADMTKVLNESRSYGKEDLADEPIFDNQVMKETSAHIDSLKQTNALYKEEKFLQEFYDGVYTNLSDFAREWISDYHEGSTDWRHFSEAIILCLHTIGRIDDTELLNFINLKDKELDIFCDGGYNKYISELDKVAGVVKKEEIDDDSIEDLVVEDESQEEKEGDIINMYTDYLDILDQSIEEIKEIPENLRSKEVQKILNYYTTCSTTRVLIDKKEEHGK